MGFKSIEFTKIENGMIFQPDFKEFVKNNLLTFSKEGIAVVYGPNGTGKTSLAKIMGGLPNTAIQCVYEGETYTEGTSIFYVINDQNDRNIIRGTARDFLLGSNIKREFELEKKVSEQFSGIINWLVASLKNDCGISSVSSKLIPLIRNSKTAFLIKDIVNSRSRGSNHTTEMFIEILSKLSMPSISELDEEKWEYFSNNYGNNNTILMKVLKLTAPDFIENKNASKIEEDSVAIDVLSKFKHRTHCIVCDNADINSEALIEQKTTHRQAVIDALTEQMKSFIEDVLLLQANKDPFNIKNHILKALENGNYQIIEELQEDIKKYIGLVAKKIDLLLLSIPEYDDFLKNYTEHQKLISQKPDITEEDFGYIKAIISNSMNKNITLTRDGNKNLKILLEEKEFIGIERDELPLSTGEQNFLSLCFEFLKAQSSKAKIIVIDDPISSFDSIYKNKIIFAMVKMLEKKPRIILTHNIDLLRLLQAQYADCFHLFLLNNTNGGTNGLIPLSKDEQIMLINLKELLETFRHKIYSYIDNTGLFLISMIPFMRGYANIIDKREEVEKLTKLMHGYMNEKVDIAEIYFSLFGNDGKDILPLSYFVSVDDILSKTVDGVNIIDISKYPLLDKTLRHSFTYLSLRLLVEKTLVAKYSIDTNKYDQLGTIINRAFPGTDTISIRRRVQLTSKKTLINEFNHFEGNLSIFQPAIDITDESLYKEKNDVLQFISDIENDYLSSNL